MSTDFICPELDDSDDTRFVQWSRRGTDGQAPSWEFGTEDNFRECLAMLDMGLRFIPVGGHDCGTPTTIDGWFDMLERDRVTFGMFPVTVRAFSEAHFRFMEDE